MCSDNSQSTCVLTVFTAVSRDAVGAVARLAVGRTHAVVHAEDVLSTTFVGRTVARVGVMTPVLITLADRVYKK